MRRLISLLAVMLVMAAMMLAMALPAFAKATQTETPCFLGRGGFDPSGHLVITDSGNANLSCHVNAQKTP